MTRKRLFLLMVNRARHVRRVGRLRVHACAALATLGLGCSENTGPAPVASVTVAVALPTATVFVGGTVQLSATPKDANGNVLTDRAVSWASTVPSVASVSTQGLVRGLAPGVATITATIEGRTGAAPITVITLSLTRVSTGASFACGVTPAGDGVCWGTNFHGQLGDGVTKGTAQPIPVLVAGGLSFATVNASGGSGFYPPREGGGHACAVTAAGAAYCWGYNTFSQLGIGTFRGPQECSGGDCSSVPEPVAGGHIFAMVSTGSIHTCGVTITGAAYCWGSASFGVLGNEDRITPKVKPVLVHGGLSFTSITAGTHHTCGLTALGAAYCWGASWYGEIGFGGYDIWDYPVPVRGGHNFVAISAGHYRTCGVTAAGDAYCWGFNGNGELGDGTRTDRFSPVRVIGEETFVAVTVGTYHTCALTAGGAAFCWGYNYNGELGDGTTTRSSAPVPVVGGLTFTVLSAGDAFTCGVTATSDAYCWGYNGSGQLGDGTTDTRLTPGRVGR